MPFYFRFFRDLFLLGAARGFFSKSKFCLFCLLGRVFMVGGFLGGRLVL